jgi:uncharacterized protein YfiM (DUF2279 family)
MNYFFRILMLGFTSICFAQSKVDRYLTPSDSLNIPRKNTVLIGQSVAMGGTLIALSQAWYKDYEKTDFHLYNDNIEWLQVDKVGHAFSAYQLSRASSEMYQWSGIDRKKSAVYGSLTGFGFLSMVEIFDGYSAEWGFSYGDVLANLSGSVFYAGQEFLWEEQRILLKFSFHTTPYASRRPQVLGENLQEQILKDYNGQTYWLSFNAHSFFKESKLPKWLNLAIGYGAEGMVTGQDYQVNTIFLPEKHRFRQYYLSLDVDLTKINTQSHFLKTLFSIVNTIKIPAPTVEFNSKGTVEFHPFYF